jgi:hypothetical protein
MHLSILTYSTVVLRRVLAPLDPDHQFPLELLLVKGLSAGCAGCLMGRTSVKSESLIMSNGAARGSSTAERMPQESILW